MIENKKGLVLYGWLWCSHCYEAALFLKRNNISYEAKMMEDKRVTGEVFKMTGKVSGPTIVFPDGTWLQNPGTDRLYARLEELGMLLSEEQL